MSAVQPDARAQWWASLSPEEQHRIMLQMQAESVLRAQASGGAPAMSGPTLWEIDPQAADDVWLEVWDPEGWYSAIVKWDGCIHFHRYFNNEQPREKGHGRPEDCDYLHICDIDDEIRRLEALRDLARRHFPGEWPR